MVKMFHSAQGTVTYTSTKVVHTFTTSGEFRTFFTTNNENGDLYQFMDVSNGLTADILLIGGGGSGGSGSLVEIYKDIIMVVEEVAAVLYTHQV